MSLNYVLLLIVPLVLGLWAQSNVKSAFAQFSKVRASANITGAETARQILHAARITDVSVEQVDGMLGDHYDPTHKRLCLSADVYNSYSVAALGVAAHETGHAIQDACSYAPLKARMAVVPLTQFASQLLPLVMFGGFFFHAFAFIKLGVLVYGILTVFQLVTLPVEFDASRRAKIILGELGLVLPGAETQGVHRVLNAAALTYVAAFVAALSNLIYFFLLSNRRNN